MQIDLSDEQQEAQARFRAFVREQIDPGADRNDREGQTPPELIRTLAAAGYLGAVVPRHLGGQEMDAITFGLLCEAIGRSSASLLSLITVHSMVCHAILKWGSAAQRTDWLPRLAAGERVGAFALTEPQIGSDARNVESAAVIGDGAVTLNGEKKWISFAQVADLFLIVAQCDGSPCAVLVERDTPGFATEAIGGLLGFRSAMLAKVRMDACRVPATHLLGRVGFGFSHIAGTALDLGRYCVAWGCLGLGQACLDACLSYTSERRQFGELLKGHQLIQRMIADMITQVRAARLLCFRAGELRDKADPSSILETSIAKYFASRTVSRIADDAVQIHGANGCSSEYRVERYLRDAKIMEIIEGSTQMQQLIIAKSGYHGFIRDQREARQREARES